MFKRVVTHKGFWRSVISLALAFIILFVLVKWAIEGFTIAYFTENDPITFFLGIILAGFIYGFFVAYGKFSSRIKKQDRSR